MRKFTEIYWHMKTAYDLALKAEQAGDVPIGAVLISKDGQVISKSYNTKEEKSCCVNHAEVLCIQEGSQELSNWRLSGCSLFVTLEPCLMCMAAIREARIKDVYFGAYDPKGGAISLGYRIHKDIRLNHAVEVYGGFDHTKNSQLLSRFFKSRRKTYKKS